MKRTSSGLAYRRILLRAAVPLTLALLSPWQSAIAQGTAPAYPSRPIKIIVPNTAGGLVDLFARTLAQYMAGRMGQPVIVDNRPGGNQIIGTTAVARSEPDGYTLLLATQTAMVFNPIIKKQLPYDPARDFTPVSTLFATPFYLTVRPSLPAKSVKDVIDLARKDPGRYTFASIGAGSSQQLAAEMFRSRTKLDMLHIPFRGSPEVSVALISGQVDMAFESGASSLSNIRAGKVRALATSSKRRTAALPDVPALDETIPGLEYAVWFGLAAPAGTPAAIVDRLNRVANDMMRLPETQKKFADLDVELMPGTPAEFAARLRDDVSVWAPIIQAAGLKDE